MEFGVLNLEFVSANISRHIERRFMCGEFDGSLNFNDGNFDRLKKKSIMVLWRVHILHQIKLVYGYNFHTNGSADIGLAEDFNCHSK